MPTTSKNKSANLFEWILNIVVQLIKVFILIWLVPKEILEDFYLFKIKTKEQLAQYYEITRKTLTKWVLYFTPYNIQKYKSKRKFEDFEIINLMRIFGTVTKNQQPLTKGEIIKKCSTYYKTLRENVNRISFGMSQDVYKSVDMFPPKVSKDILKFMVE